MKTSPVLLAGLFLIAGLLIIPAFVSPTHAVPIYWVGAKVTDSSVETNTGVRSQMQVVTTPISGCLAFFVAEASTANVWGQVGYYLCDSSTPVGFYQIWNLTSDVVLSGGAWAVGVGLHLFSMQVTSGDTWGYYMDGTSEGTYNMAGPTSESSYPLYILSEEQGFDATFPEVQFPTAIQALEGASWVGASSAVVYNNGGAWGVQGASQNGTLGPDSLSMGGPLIILPAGVQLWEPTTTTSSTTTASTVSVASTSTATTTSPMVSTTATSSSSSTTSPTATSASSTSSSTTTVLITTTVSTTPPSTSTASTSSMSTRTIGGPSTTTASSHTNTHTSGSVRFPVGGCGVAGYPACTTMSTWVTTSVSSSPAAPVSANAYLVLLLFTVTFSLVFYAGSRKTRRQ